MRSCAFLTTDDLAGFVTDDDLVHEPLRELGWEVTPVAWRRPGVNWDRFQAVVIRSTWDYYKDLDEFLRVLEAIDRSGARLANSLEIVRWNVRKTYLRDLHERGIPVVPTVWEISPPADWIRGLFDELGTDQIVIKPVVSASANDTYLLHRAADRSREMEAVFAGRECMVQPFLRNIVEEGEHSLFYFGGELSHAVIKTPQERDFRVQEEHGGLVLPSDPSGALVALGDRTLAALPIQPLYARVDLVRHDPQGYVLMELELVEPALYFRIAPAAAPRFARSFQAWMNGDTGVFPACDTIPPR